ncbi:hypothetical protein NLI96_g5933 [Meripilus lineatus]|uniref:Uncharacterized protein n=1 Tax=Meripilus lineatus TaxID=2056292 RepID=A0AAD5V7F6_9APHY|nr:hypothetical protein NLI96_g5933 [Physisporinus lineatus]
MDHLIDFLTNSTPSVTDSIREIRISSGPGARDESYKPHFSTVRPYLLASLLDRLQKLHTIVLDRVYWDPVVELDKQDVSSSWPPTPRHLKTLILDDVIRWGGDDSLASHSLPLHPPEAIGLLQLFSCIEQLDITYTTSEIFVDSLAAIRTGTVQALTLRDHCDDSINLLYNLSRLGVLEGLGSLSVEIPNALPEAERYFEFIRDTSATLNSLDVVFLGYFGAGVSEYYIASLSARQVLIRVLMVPHVEAAAWDQFHLTERQFPSLLSLGFEVELGPASPFFYALGQGIYHTDTPAIKRENLSIWSYIVNLTQSRPPLIKSLTITHNILISHGISFQRLESVGPRQGEEVAEVLGFVDWKRVTSALNGWGSLEEVCIGVKVRLVGFNLQYGEDQRAIVEGVLRRSLGGLSPSIKLVLQLDPPTWL